MSKKTLNPDYIFETSWEVCNKVGGIHTVISTKALSISKKFKDKYILIGPDLWQHTENHEFVEDTELFKSWKANTENEGLRVRVGRWNIAGNPLVILVDFSRYFANKNEILRYYWDTYQLDSLNSSWDYIESVLFGYAAAKVIESFVNFNVASRENIICHFHEWMTGSGLLYVEDKMPKVGSVFTTHATVVGRSIAGNGYPLYNTMKGYQPEEMAYRFGVQHKHFLEKIAAKTADCFTTVSDITAQESLHFLGRKADVITPNGFEDSFVPNAKTFTKKRKDAKKQLHNVAQALVGYSLNENIKMVAISGRYEFRNKGIDAFIDALGALNRDTKNDEELVAFILIPTAQEGPNKGLVHNMQMPQQAVNNEEKHLTHYLSDFHNDQILRRIYEQQLYNRKEDKVKVIFCPSYLDGKDGVFNLPYYDVLIGLDATAFPSYYEPWGYTPLESLAFKVPTITTSLSGFGKWVTDYYPESPSAINILKREDSNYGDIVGGITKNLIKLLKMKEEELEKLQNEASEIAQIALWKNLSKHYLKCYQLTLQNIESRVENLPNIDAQTAVYFEQTKMIKAPNWRNVIIHRSMPQALLPLEELSKNLWWCWNDKASELFKSIDVNQWIETRKNPIALLDTISLSRYKELENDADFMKKLKEVYAEFKKYMAEKEKMTSPTVAYFSMEYGLHSSLKIYSGGLGILAGDYLKEASDKATKITGVGLLYRYGYFTQKLSSAGNQEADYEAQDFTKIPVTPVMGEDGRWLTVSVDLPQRTLYARVWRVDVGRIELYLLDTDFEDNRDDDRSVTHHLYGGNWENRLKQEMLLGLGGIKMLRKLNIDTDVYHCNEGHAAFIGLERLREYIQNDKLSFSEAMEVVRASSLFTTHTPVPAGHDFFEEGMLRAHIEHYTEKLHVSWQQILSLGKIDVYNPREKFSMSNLAANLSQEVNGVSWLHGEVSKDIFKDLWPGYMPDELHISYVTNGVHQPTWTSPLWKEIQNEVFGEDFKTHQYNPKSFEGIYKVSDKRIWEVKTALRGKLLRRIEQKLRREKNTPYFSPKQLVEIKENLRDDILTIGFARRFATYKRAHLLFSNIERLDKIVNNPDRPVQFIFAGKAHPADKAGQDLIKHIVEISKLPQFLGKILFIPNYDMELARHMVQGVDVWMNTPTRPQEASGTSGEKAVMNGVMHFSVLDGWWVEGYREDAGWALPMERAYENQEYQNELDAELIYNIIEDEIAPAFYDKDKDGISQTWCSYIKNTIAKVAVNFTTNRMLTDYEKQYYYPMSERAKKLKADKFATTIQISDWKKRVSNEWDNIKVVNVDVPNRNKQVIAIGKTYKGEVTLDLGSLSMNDIGMELVVAEQKDEKMKVLLTKEFKAVSQQGSLVKYVLEVVTEYPGSLQLAVRIFPKNELLPHRQDFALVKWL
ncbi:alpha-glucan family phosphorylase [Capnocytophaga canimorsus]|uniref:alpha-glucan family phosphorylase n=1 Tax=Capnocytophaga canimorsus TaxID=28188 RepID=UPI000F7110B9|nr:alpha-glucan family phosphorylase [Capnocytophaga canimorsus]VEJ19907.1 Maltodextrin phosphorylase [Capnocytophaga canimorsus]